jgi:hypothetical protein
MKDAKFTVRAQLGSALGSMGNPFTMVGLAGKATRTVDAGVLSATGTAARTRGGASLPTATSAVESSDGVPMGAKVGFGFGISVGVILIAIVAFFIIRSRRRARPAEDAEKKSAISAAELHEDAARVYQLSAKEVFPKVELPGRSSPRYEMGARASTYLVELPSQNSRRQSQR